jgi:5-oxoprolinase (ATP-hydrolysing)
MDRVQDAAAEKVRQSLTALGDGEWSFADAMDDGSPIQVRLTIRGQRATFDFAGSSAEVDTNLNANRAIVKAAVLYSLRCLIDEDIPLNDGVLEPIDLLIPVGILDPPWNADPRLCPAVVGGNVETSQRITDVVLGALRLVAASQGTMNNFTFGNETFGYYETICGGAGAGEGFHGTSAVHTHMTNTRLTDPEVLEARYPVVLRRFEIRRGSGGAGRWRGGDGVVREIEFLEPLEVSLLTQRRARPPFGMDGGESGSKGRNWWLRRDGENRELPGVCTLEVDAGDRVRIETPGGGGWGRPRAGDDAEGSVAEELLDGDQEIVEAIVVDPVSSAIEVD